MSRLIVVLLLALASNLSSGAESSLRFDRVPVYDLCRVVFGEVLHESYILDSSLLSAERLTTLDVRGASGDQLRRALELVLSAEGYAVRRDGAVNVVERLKSEQVSQAVFSYLPKFRTVKYLQDSIRAFVSRGRFAGVTSAAVGAIAAPSAGGGQVPGQAQVPASQSVTQITPGGGVAIGSMDVLLFQGEAVEVELVRSLAERLDVPAVELAIRATVFEVQTQNSDVSAVQLALRLLGGRVALATGGPLAELATARLTLSSFDAAVSMLSQDSRFKLVSAPSLRVTSGESARVSVGADVPVLGAVTVPANGAPVQSVSYQSSGVILDIRPVALREFIRVHLSQQLSSFTQTTTGVNASPTLLKREVSSAVAVRSGEAVLLGGLDESNENDGGSGLSFLPHWFWTKMRGKSRTELVILLQVDALEKGQGVGSGGGADRGS